MVTIPQPPAGNFTTKIDNPYMTLRPGTSFVFEDKETGSSDVFTVTRQTKVIDGITCVVVHDIAYENGLKVEETFDWFAQDSAGNVWYFGEQTNEFEPGNPDPINANGAWEAGVNGAKAGIVMLANPQVGDTYMQEDVPGIAEDFANVLAINTSQGSEYGYFGSVLKTEDVNPLDPSIENKYYAKGVGVIVTTNEDGGRQELTDIMVKGTSKADTLIGYSGGDEMYGYGGRDTMKGGTGSDEIFGGNGSDKLFGESGFDDLYGGAGNDRMKGGSGGDSFIFRHLKNGVKEADTITDYKIDQLDVIDIGGKGRIAKQYLDDGEWHLRLKGDGDVIKIIGAVDADRDGRIVDDLLIA